MKEAKVKNVLVINDDTAMLVAFKFMLKSPHLNVKTTESVEEAKEYLKVSNVDIILSDLDLGKGMQNGYDLLKWVRERDKEIPFYIISGYNKDGEESRAMDSGANGFIQLPVDAEQIRTLVSS